MIILPRISTAEKLRGLFFVMSCTPLTPVDNGLHEKTNTDRICKCHHIVLRGDNGLQAFTSVHSLAVIVQLNKRESYEKNQEMPVLWQRVQHAERSEEILLHGMCRSCQAGDKEEKEQPS